MNYPKEKRPEGAFLQGVFAVYLSDFLDLAGFDVHKIFGQHGSAAQHLCVVLFFGNVLLYGYVQVAAHHHDFGGRVVVEVDNEVNLAVVREILLVVVQLACMM